MKKYSNIQKGFIVPIIVALVALVAIGGGTYVYQQKRASKTDAKSPQEITWSVYHDKAGYAFNYPSDWTVKSDEVVSDGLQTTLSKNGVAEVKIAVVVGKKTNQGMLLQSCPIGGPQQAMADNAFTVMDVSKQYGETAIAFCTLKGNTRYELLNIGNTSLNNQIISSLHIES